MMIETLRSLVLWSSSPVVSVACWLNEWATIRRRRLTATFSPRECVIWRWRDAMPARSQSLLWTRVPGFDRLNSQCEAKSRRDQASSPGGKGPGEAARSPVWSWRTWRPRRPVALIGDTEWRMFRCAEKLFATSFSWAGRISLNGPNGLSKGTMWLQKICVWEALLGQIRGLNLRQSSMLMWCGHGSTSFWQSLWLRVEATSKVWLWLSKSC